MAVRKTTIEIDEDVMAEVQAALGTTGIKDTIDEALARVRREAAFERLVEWVRETPELRDPEFMRRGWDRSDRWNLDGFRLPCAT